MTQFIFKLYQYRLEHGNLPANLSDVVDDSNSIEIRDAAIAAPFLYFPAGIPDEWAQVRELVDQYNERRTGNLSGYYDQWPIFLRPEGSLLTSDRLTPEEAAKPFLWCPSLGRVVIAQDPIGLAGEQSDPP
jgi:hypothetical protein